MRTHRPLILFLASAVIVSAGVEVQAQPEQARLLAVLELVDRRLPQSGAIEVTLDSETSRSFFRAVYFYDSVTRAFFRVHHKFIIGRVRHRARLHRKPR